MAITRSQNRKAALAAAVTRSQKRKAELRNDPLPAAVIQSSSVLRRKRRCGTRFPTSRLGKLPAELRNYIYELSLADLPQHLKLRSFQQPALTRVCKQLRKEYLPMVYARLQTMDWTVPLPLPHKKDLAVSVGLKKADDFWRYATLPWLRDIPDFATTGSVTFVAILVNRASVPRRAEGHIELLAIFPKPEINIIGGHALMSNELVREFTHGGRAMFKIYHESSSELRALKGASSIAAATEDGGHRIALHNVATVVRRFGGLILEPVRSRGPPTRGAGMHYIPSSMTGMGKHQKKLPRTPPPLTLAEWTKQYLSSSPEKQVEMRKTDTYLYLQLH